MIIMVMMTKTTAIMLMTVLIKMTHGLVGLIIETMITMIMKATIMLARVVKS